MVSESGWLTRGKEIPADIAIKYGVELPPEAGREIFEQIKAHCCNGCVLKESGD